MKSCVVSVRDSAMQSFGRPVFVPSVGYAIRSFSDEINRHAEDNQMHRHPEDFELVYLADFDEGTGQFSVPAEGQRVLARGKDVKRDEKRD